MAKYISNRQQNLKIGIVSYTENETVLEVTGGTYISGSVGIGTTTPTSKLTVIGDVLVSGVLTASHIVGTSLSISGISTFGGNVNIGTGITMYASTGIISATAFYGNGQNLSDIIAAKLAGITVLEENTLVGTAYQFSELKFVGSYVTATGIGSTATITFTTPESVIGGVASVTSLNVTGISTLGSVEISSGIVTAKTGIVTYYGDGSKLTGVSAFSVQQQSITASPVASVGSLSPPNSNLVAEMQLVNNSEDGDLFVTRAGVIKFTDRNYVYTNTSSNTSQATFASGSIPFQPSVQKYKDGVDKH